jgi:hypothetical protein
MKMHDITNEAKGTAALDVATKLGSKAWSGAKDIAGKVFNWNEKNVYSKPVQKSADDIAAKNAERTARRAPSELAVKNAEDELARIAATKSNLSSVVPKGSKLPVPKDEYVNKLNTTISTNNPIINKNSPIKPPEFDKVSKLRYTIPAATADLALGKATASEEDPEGYSAIRGLAGLAKDAAVGTTQLPGKVLTGLDKGVISSEPEGGPDSSAKETDPNKPQLEENISDILKLSGVKRITSRDNVSGLTKVKEVTKLNESKQIDECGMGMQSNSSTPATLSINATASSGEEVANMLKSIMDLAGVKPVTADMLGGQMAPMPMVKAIDIISKGEPDRMNDVGDKEMVSEPITIVPKGSDKTPTTDQTTGPNAPDIEKPINDNYSNTPEDPTDVPKYDPEKMVFRPNQPGQGDRMDGTMPKGNPGLGEGLAQSLLKEYEAFKNGQ